MVRAQWWFSLALVAVLGGVAVAPAEYKPYILLAGPVLLGTMTVAVAAGYVSLAHRAGPQLVAGRSTFSWLNLGRLALRLLFRLPLFFLLALVGTYVSAYVAWVGAASLAAVLLTGAIANLAGSSGVQLHENGVLLFGLLIPWDRIESVAWEEGADPVLRLELTTSLPPPRNRWTVRTVVAAESRDYVASWITGLLSEAAAHRSESSSQGPEQTAKRGSNLRRALAVPVMPLLVLVIGGSAVVVHLAPARLGFTVSAMTKHPDPPPVSAATRDGRWRQDLQYLATELPRLHPDLYFHESKSEFDASVADLDAAIPSMDDGDIAIRLTQIVASVGDAHTGVDLPLDSRKYGFHQFPLTLWWFGDGLYVTATPRDDQRALGSRVLRIGDTDVNQAYQAVSALIPHEVDGAVRAASPEYLVSPDVLAAAGILPDASGGRLAFEGNDGSQFSLDLTSLPADQRVDWVAASGPWLRRLDRVHADDKNYWYSYLADSQTLYVQYNECRDMDDLSFADFTKQVFQFADSHPVQRFVIDLRYNEGGDAQLAQPLIDGLKKRSRLSRRGSLFVIIGRDTFSAAVMAAFSLRQQANALLVGEPAGQGPNFFAGNGSFELPNSVLKVHYSQARIQETKTVTDSLDPDISAPPTWQGDYLAGQDSAMQAILAYPH